MSNPLFAVFVHSRSQLRVHRAVTPMGRLVSNSFTLNDHFGKTTQNQELFALTHASCVGKMNSGQHPYNQQPKSLIFLQNNCKCLSMRTHIMKIVWTYFLVFAQTQLCAQSEFVKERNEIIDKIEIMAGLNLNFPNDHGWSGYILKSSQGLVIEELGKKTGSFIGFGLHHSLSERFSIQGKFLIEKKEHSRSITTLDLNGDIYGESHSDQKNDYVSFSIIPSLLVSKSRRLELFSGFSYAYVTNARVYSKHYSHGQYVGGAIVNIIQSERNVIDAIMGVGYLFPLNKSFAAIFRVQGNYGLSYTSNQNRQKTSINSASLSLGFRYSR